MIASDASELVAAENLRVAYTTRDALGRRSTVNAVSSASFAVSRSGVLGIIGETGSGKSTVAKALAGIVAPASGRIMFGGTDVSNLSRAARRQWRRGVQYVFQNANDDLNPYRTVEQTLTDVLRAGEVHAGRLDGAAIRDQLTRTLSELALGESMLSRYPHGLSGGEHQRVCIARALLPDPWLLILDEPTSALDASIKLNVIKILKDLRSRRELAMIIVSHDLAVVRELTQQCLVMYKGEIVENGETEAVLSAPSHGYTKSLVRASTYTTLRPA